MHARYDTPGGIRKVGRKPKVYEPTGADIRVSIPERRHDVIAEILLDAVLAELPGEGARAAALRTARSRGQDIGAAERARIRPGRLGPERSLSATQPLLAQYGFEPDRRTPTSLSLQNCPFHHLVARSTELVCAINHAFLGGILEGLEATGVGAVLAPCPGRCCCCCVELREPADTADRPAASRHEPGPPGDA